MRTKHIDVRYHYEREQVEAEVMTLTWVPSVEQIADILTKPLASHAISAPARTHGHV
jgi:hypothetical protein